MSQLHIQRAIEIKAPIEKVCRYVESFKNWKAWSPWSVLDPEAIVENSSDGKSHTWDGKIIGKGKILLLEEILETGFQDSQEYLYELKCHTPHKFSAQVKIRLQTEGLYTQVSWDLHTSLPVLLRLQKNNLFSQLSTDYERGLKMLKDLVENGAIHSSLSVIGERTLVQTQYLTLPGSSTLKNLYDSISESLQSTVTLYKNPKIWTDTEPLIIYDKYDAINGLCVYRIGIPVKFKPDKDDYPSCFKYIELPPSTAYLISHKGAPHHLKNAWTLGATLSRKKVFKRDKDAPIMEIYKHPPTEFMPEQDRLIYVLFPTA